MCNNYRLAVDATTIIQDFADLKITVRFSEGDPNIAARDDIKITDVAPMLSQRSISATIASFCSSVQILRRPAILRRTSGRPTGSRATPVRS